TRATGRCGTTSRCRPPPWTEWSTTSGQPRVSTEPASPAQDSEAASSLSPDPDPYAPDPPAGSSPPPAAPACSTDHRGPLSGTHLGRHRRRRPTVSPHAGPVTGLFEGGYRGHRSVAPVRRRVPRPHGG